MTKIKVYFECTKTYAAELDYDELARLAATEDPEEYMNPDDVLTIPAEADLPPGKEVTMDAWPGAELSERIWETGREIDSSETRVTGLERI